jgi:RHS repeat-associated protein
MTNVSISSATVKIKDPTGAVIASRSVGTGGGTLDASLTMNGTHSILVDPIEQRTGHMTLALSLLSGLAAQSAPESDGAGPVTSSAELADFVDGYEPYGAEEWIPDPGRLNDWTLGRSYSPLMGLPPLTAESGTAAVSGQVLRLDGRPLPGVTLQMGSSSTTTDEGGRFLLQGVQPGRGVVLVDGSTAQIPGKTYGSFDIGVDVRPRGTTALDVIWMPVIDEANAVPTRWPARREFVLTTPTIPGLEIRIPAGATVVGRDGEPVESMSITPVPLDQAPFPIPAGVAPPAYFTVQPGGLHVEGGRARVIYPNYQHLDAGARADLWIYEPGEEGWEIYGGGTVSADGRRIVPDPGVGVYEFAGVMLGEPHTPWLLDLLGMSAGDPVDIATGLFDYQKTDLSLPGPMPISLTRMYRQSDLTSHDFGVGFAMPYEAYLYPPVPHYQQAEMIMAGERRVHFDRISPGDFFGNAVMEAAPIPGPYFGSLLAFSDDNLDKWILTRRDGTTLVFNDVFSDLLEIRDRFGNRLLVLGANGTNPGPVTQLVSYPSGRWISFSLTSNKISEAKDNSGRTVQYAYEGSAPGLRLKTVTDANQVGQPTPKKTTYTWTSVSGCNPSNVMTAIKDPRDITFLPNTYGAGCRVSQQTVPTATGTETWDFAYTLDGQGRITQTDITDPNEVTRRVTFDSTGRPSTDTVALGTLSQRTLTYERDTNHLVSAVVDSFHGRRTEFTYDAFGDVLTSTRLDGTAQAVTTQYTYTPKYHQLDTMTDPLSHVTDFDYDASGCLDKIMDGALRSTTFDCNGAGQVNSVTDGRGKTTTFFYVHGDLKTVTDPLGQTTSRFTDASGRVSFVTDQLNYVTRYSYDNLNQVTKITDPVGRDIALEYDANGNLRFVRDQRGATESTTQFTYNDQDLVQTKIDPLGRSESFTYDDNGNVATWTDRKNQVTEYRYDPLGRVTFAGFNRSGSPPNYTYGSTINSTYDVGGRLTQVADSTSGAGTITRGYDDLDRLTSDIQSNAPSPGVVYTYWDDGTRRTMTVPGQTQITYGYNDAGQLISLTQGSNVVGIDYFADGRLQTLTLKPSPTPVVQSYVYDDAGQLSSITYTHGASTDDLSYGYDPAGQRVGVWGTYGRVGLPAATTSNAIYDLANRLTGWNGATISHDNNGNLTSDGTFTYTYNPRNQLTLVKQGTQTRGSFIYDGLGRRVVRTVGGATTKPAYDGWNLVQERASNGSVSANYLIGLGLDQPFLRTAGSSTSYYLSDALGSIVGLASSTGTVPTSYTYEPYGKTTVSGTASPSFLGFTGRENDSTGSLSLYNYRARAYSPTLHRFLTEDPIGPWGGDTNLYAYVTDSPLVMTDPLGLQRTEDCGFALLTCAGIGLQFLGRFAGDSAGWIGLGAAFASFVFPWLAPIALWAVGVQAVGFAIASLGGALQGDAESAMYDLTRMGLAALGGTVASSSIALRPPLIALERGILTGVTSSFDLLLNLCDQDSDCDNNDGTG